MRKTTTRRELLAAIDDGDLSRVKSMLAEGAPCDRGHWPLRVSESPLCLAVQRRFGRVIELLLRAGAPVDEVGSLGYNALQIASHGSDASAVGILLSSGADPRSYRQRPSPLALAAFAGSREVVALIIASGGDPQDVWNGGPASAIRLHKSVLRELVAGSPSPPQFALQLVEDEDRE